MGKKLDRFMRDNDIPADADMWDDEDLAHDNGVDRIVFVMAGGEDWELWKNKGKWAIEGHGSLVGPWAKYGTGNWA